MLGLGSSPSSQSEAKKRNMLLRTLHREGVSSRMQLARLLHISNSRVCDLIDQLVADGLVGA